MDLTEILAEVAKQGPVVGLLVYQLIRNQNIIDAKDTIINGLHKEMRDRSDASFERLANITTKNQDIISGLKEVFKG